MSSKPVFCKIGSIEPKDLHDLDWQIMAVGRSTREERWISWSDIINCPRKIQALVQARRRWHKFVWTIDSYREVINLCIMQSYHERSFLSAALNSSSSDRDVENSGYPF